MESRHLGVVVRREPATVAAFAREHLAEWAAGLAAGHPRPDPADPGVLVVDSPMGEVRVRFAPANDLGVLDHAVELPGGAVVLNPLRVLPHPHGAEVVFTLRRLDGVTSEAFEADAAAVAADLARLRALLEP
ncbi:SRPBCC family protein [Agrococcus sp. SL85]|uniref:SRPBCC family protein n=1 Tax=Agrococcus sp. SL85 TaxID=2995141 RepID=UPI00226CFEA3|nr:SRPBCC family protein [Agrococcus sp. SL85]WAC65917.1 SRPBCC family protein [Agrococcus sp. SL85]